jgi:hypothetical protein
MSIVSQNILSALKSLNQELVIEKECRTLIACGGGVLSVMGVISRQTRDLDVITPNIDDVLLKCSHRVANKLGLDIEWLNNGPSGFIRDLEKGWELRTEIIFNGSHLTVKALSRHDLIATKLQGMCDRDEYDMEVLLNLKVTIDEVSSLKNWVLKQDGSVYWPERVESQFKKLLNRIKNGE